jgi:hypothetical protein
MHLIEMEQTKQVLYYHLNISIDSEKSESVFVKINVLSEIDSLN